MLSVRLLATSLAVPPSALGRYAELCIVQSVFGVALPQLSSVVGESQPATLRQKCVVLNRRPSSTLWGFNLVSVAEEGLRVMREGVLNAPICCR
jgi:hypothetical protein